MATPKRDPICPECNHFMEKVEGLRFYGKPIWQCTNRDCKPKPSINKTVSARTSFHQA